MTDKERIAQLERQNANLVQYNSEQVIKRREAHALLKEALPHINDGPLRRSINKALINKHKHET